MIAASLLFLMATAPAGPPEPVTHSVSGSVAAAGYTAVAGATVAAFSAETLELLEVVTADDLGSYAFDDLPQTVHLFARGAEGSNLAATWHFDLDLAIPQDVDFSLKQGAPITVRALDANGAPVAGASVVAYEAEFRQLREIGVVDEATTGPDGTATILAPTFAHIAVDASSDGLLPTWKFRRRLSVNGGTLNFQLAEGVPATGHIFSSSMEPLAGMDVSVWAYSGGSWHWSGLQSTDANGQYSILKGTRYTRIYARDPEGSKVPASRFLRGAGSSNLPDLMMPQGQPLTLQVTDEAELPLKAKVWAYSLENRSWSFCGYTPEDGSDFVTTVSSRFHLVVRPIDRSHLGRALWNETAAGAEERSIKLIRGKDLEISVLDEDGNALSNVNVRASIGGGHLLGGRTTRSDGKATVSVASVGINTIRVSDRAHGSARESRLLKVNGTSTESSLQVTLRGADMVDGTIVTLDNQPVTEPMRVISRSSLGWRQTITEDGTFSIPAGDRYHLLFLPVDQESRFLPLWHWNNVRRDDRVHARGPAVLTRGYRAEVQVVSKETSDGVPGVRVRGGWPTRISDAEGWVQTLLPPVYSLRNYPPAVSPSNPNPIIPDRFRSFQAVEEDRTRDTAGELEPIEVFTQLGTVAHGRVVGERADGTVGPIPGVRVLTVGGRRWLGNAYTDANGEYHALAVKYDSEYEFETALVALPHRSQPYLPEVQRGLQLTETVGSGVNEVGDLTVDSAAFGRGRVVDAFGDAIDDRTVTFHTRRLDERPRWLIGRGRVDENGEFTTKVSENSRFWFFTKFWNQRWYRKRFDQQRSFSLGEEVALGDFELGEASIVEFRAVTSTESQGGNASPIANAYVELVRVSDGKVLDHCRTAGDGKAQLRGPEATPVKLRFHFFHYSYSILGVGFEPVYSDVFAPQETESFTLDEPITNIGNYYILSPLKAEALAFVRLISETDESAFSSPSFKDALLLGATSAGRLAALIEPEIDTATAQGILDDSAALFARIDGFFMTPDVVTDPSVLSALRGALTAVVNDISLLQDSIENH